MTSSHSSTPSRTRRCFLHIGTHKTGTTSLQAFLAANEPLLATAGVFVPQAGRSNPEFAGHHNIAWELLGDSRFDPASGTMRDLFKEIAAVDSDICLSSEDFEYLHDKPTCVSIFLASLRDAGFIPIVIIYLRPQVEYISSLYAELVRHEYRVSFREYLNQVIADGSIFFKSCRSYFAYENIIQAWADALDDAPIVKAYRVDSANDVLLRDFLCIITGNPNSDLEYYARPPRCNPSLTYPEVLCELGVPLPDFALPREPFDPIHLSEAIRIHRRFARGNHLLGRRFQIDLPAVPRHKMVAEIQHFFRPNHHLRNRHRQFLRDVSPAKTLPDGM